jgi:arsenate reductase
MGFGAPPQLAAASKNEEEALIHYRNIRDKIKSFIKKLPRLLA